MRWRRWPALLGLLLGACDAAPERPNVVLITVDTLRADRLGCYGGAAGTPRIDRLAAEGVRFPDAYATAPITAPSHASLLTGLLPVRHGVLTNVAYVLTDDHTTLAEIYAERGYRTAAFVGAVPLGRMFGFAQGFDHYDDDFSGSVLDGVACRERLYGTTVASPERRGDEVIEPALAWLDANAGSGEPFFLWIHLFDPHHPYTPPAPFDRAAPEDAEGPDATIRSIREAPQPWHCWITEQEINSSERVVGLYDGEVAFADAQVGHLLDALDRLGRRDDTVVALTADHGEGLGEHGETFFHGDRVHETTLRVPLVVRAPWRFEPGTVARVRARGTDLLPTLLELTGQPAPSELDGISLVAAVAEGRAEPLPVLALAAYRDPSLAGRGVVAYLEGQRKLVVTDARRGPAAAVECFDLASDPREVRSLCPRQADDFADMRGRLEAKRRALESGAPGSLAHVPEHVRRAFEALGYTGH